MIKVVIDLSVIKTNFCKVCVIFKISTQVPS